MHNCTWVGKLCIVFRLKWLTLNTFQTFSLFHLSSLPLNLNMKFQSHRLMWSTKWKNKTKWQHDAAIERLYAYNKNHALRTTGKRVFTLFDLSNAFIYKFILKTQQLINHNNCSFEIFNWRHSSQSQTKTTSFCWKIQLSIYCIKRRKKTSFAMIMIIIMIMGVCRTSISCRYHIYISLHVKSLKHDQRHHQKEKARRGKNNSDITMLYLCKLT